MISMSCDSCFKVEGVIDYWNERTLERRRWWYLVEKTPVYWAKYYGLWRRPHQLAHPEMEVKLRLSWMKRMKLSLEYFLGKSYYAVSLSHFSKIEDVERFLVMMKNDVENLKDALKELVFIVPGLKFQVDSEGSGLKTSPISSSPTQTLLSTSRLDQSARIIKRRRDKHVQEGQFEYLNHQDSEKDDIRLNRSSNHQKAQQEYVSHQEKGSNLKDGQHPVQRVVVENLDASMAISAPPVEDMLKSYKAMERESRRSLVSQIKSKEATRSRKFKRRNKNHDAKSQEKEELEGIEEEEGGSMRSSKTEPIDGKTWNESEDGRFVSDSHLHGEEDEDVSDSHLHGDDDGKTVSSSSYANNPPTTTFTSHPHTASSSRPTTTTTTATSSSLSSSEPLLLHAAGSAEFDNLSSSSPAAPPPSSSSSSFDFDHHRHHVEKMRVRIAEMSGEMKRMCKVVEEEVIRVCHVKMVQNDVPAFYERNWMLCAVVGAVSVYGGLKFVSNFSSIRSNFIQTKSSIFNFFYDHAYLPLVNIWKTIRYETSDVGGVMTRENLEEDVESLVRMVDSFHRDKSIFPGSEKEALELAEKTRSGVIPTIMEAYESQIPHPITNALYGDLLRLALIQVQKQKVDIEKAMAQLDRLLKQNEINFQLLALLPSIVLISISSFLITRYYLQRDPYQNQHKSIRSLLRKLAIVINKSNPDYATYQEDDYQEEESLIGIGGSGSGREDDGNQLTPSSSSPLSNIVKPIMPEERIAHGDDPLTGGTGGTNESPSSLDMIFPPSPSPPPPSSSSSSNLIKSEDFGSFLCIISRLVFHAFGLPDQERIGFLEDLSELSRSTFSSRQRLATIQRMYNNYKFLNVSDS
jgi:hypothetical protein